jgi:hypothetical protein
MVTLINTIITLATLALLYLVTTGLRDLYGSTGTVIAMFTGIAAGTLLYDAHKWVRRHFNGRH